MGSKYMLTTFTYPYGGSAVKIYQTKWFIVFIARLIMAVVKYDGVDVAIRK